jgi:hypothetical protein
VDFILEDVTALDVFDVELVEFLEEFDEFLPPCLVGILTEVHLQGVVLKVIEDLH